MQKNDPKKDFTKMPITKAIITLAVPLMLTNLIMVFYQAVDAFWVGQLGKEAVAGIALSFPIFFVINSVSMGFVSAISSIIALYKGQNNQEKINYYATQAISLASISGIIIGIIGFIFAGQIVGLIGADPAVNLQATQYLSIIFLGTIFLFAYNVISGALRGVGEVKIFMLFALGGLIINFFIDPIFMFGGFGLPAMKIAGTAWATIIIQGISCVAILIWLQNKDHLLKFDKKDLVPHLASVKRLFKLGAPSSVEFLSRSIGMVLMTGIIASFGTVAIAAYGIGMRVGSFALIPSFGLSLAINVIIAQNLGAGKNEQIKQIIKTGMIFSFLFLTIVSLPLLLFPEQLSSLFISGEPEVLSEAILFTQIFALSLGLLGAQIVIVSSYRGSGKTKTAMNLALSYIVIQLVSALILANLFGLFGVWVSYPVANLIMLIITQIYYRKNPITKSQI